MLRFRQMDLLVEIGELCNDILGDIRQQLTYYRVSAYKAETARHIADKIHDLKIVAELCRTFFGDEMILEPLKDFEAVSKNAVQMPAPGECAYSNRITSLIQGFAEQVARLQHEVGKNVNHSTLDDHDLFQQINRHRSELLSLCRHGSRQWHLFQSM